MIFGLKFKVLALIESRFKFKIFVIIFSVEIEAIFLAMMTLFAAKTVTIVIVGIISEKRVMFLR